VFEEGSFKEAIEAVSKVNGWNIGRWIGNLLIHLKK
jgi:hypothetical protein